MRTYEKDYLYLLLNLVPHHRLTTARRRSVSEAIAAGDADEIRRVSVLVLEDLCRLDVFSRTSVIVDNGQVVATYARRNGVYRVRMQVPVAEWRALGQDTVGLERAQDDAGDEPRAVATAPTIEILPEIIRSFTLDDHRESLLRRLESVMEYVPGWVNALGGRLILVEEQVAEENDGELVQTLPQRAFARNVVYERARRFRQAEAFEVAAARTLNIAGPLVLALGGRDEAYRVAVAPLFCLGEFWGVLELWVAGDDTPVREPARVASDTIEQIIENSIKLENLTSVDALTRIYNRHFYDTQVRIEIERATRTGSKVSMLLVDVDDFKAINDTMGHRKGDEALALIADLIRANLRKIDLPFRYGGEEFVILLPGTSEMEAIHTAERLRMVISEHDDFRGENGEPHSLTVSIGAAVFPDHARTEDELFSRADSALYKAKRNGKNRVEFYGS